MIYLYRFIYSFLKLSACCLYPTLSPQLKKWIDLKNQPLEKKFNFSNTYWFHAASGEIEYCKSVIRLLKKQQPDAQVVVTYSSPSAEKLFSNVAELVTQFIPITWDQKESLEILFNYIRPQILIFSRTDIWPELLLQASNRNIKTGVISFNPKFNFFTRILYKHLLASLSFASCVDSAKVQQLKSLLNGTDITADGDTRFDQVFYRLEQEPKIKINCSQKIIVLGSTWAVDEEIVLSDLSFFKKNKINLILSPHQVDKQNMSRLTDLLSNNQLTYKKLSQLIETNSLDYTMSEDVLVIDKIGYLADCYRYADLAFVGGSFKDKVHSVMEPLCSGLNVLVGPFHSNSPEAIKYLNQYVFCIKNLAEFNQKILQYMGQNKNKILAEMKINKNASQRVMAIIQRHI